MSNHSTMTTILAVDDDQNIRLMCERELYSADCVRWFVSHDLEAWESIDANPQFDLIILDVKVAPIEDIQILRGLWADNTRMPGISNPGFFN